MTHLLELHDSFRVFVHGCGCINASAFATWPRRWCSLPCLLEHIGKWLRAPFGTEERHCAWNNCGRILWSPKDRPVSYCSFDCFDGTFDAVNGDEVLHAAYKRHEEIVRQRWIFYWLDNGGVLA